MDIKKQAKILPGGGWRTHGRKASSGQHHRTKTGYAFVHSAIDAHRRLAYSKVHANEQAVTMMAFWRRALTFSKATASWSNEWMTDNGSCYRSKDFVKLLVAQSIRHTFIKPYRPQTNGKVERFNRTLLNKWAYARPHPVRSRQNASVGQWLHMYNHHRHQTAIGGPPIGRVNNLVGQNI
jgi:transposase InsO family protein